MFTMLRPLLLPTLHLPRRAIQINYLFEDLNFRITNCHVVRKKHFLNRGRLRLQTLAIDENIRAGFMV